MIEFELSHQGSRYVCIAEVVYEYTDGNEQEYQSIEIKELYKILKDRDEELDVDDLDAGLERSLTEEGLRYV